MPGVLVGVDEEGRDRTRGELPQRVARLRAAAVVGAVVARARVARQERGLAVGRAERAVAGVVRLARPTVDGEREHARRPHEAVTPVERVVEDLLVVDERGAAHVATQRRLVEPLPHRRAAHGPLVRQPRVTAADGSERDGVGALHLRDVQRVLQVVQVVGLDGVAVGRVVERRVRHVRRADGGGARTHLRARVHLEVDGPLRGVPQLQVQRAGAAVGVELEVIRAEELVVVVARRAAGSRVPRARVVGRERDEADGRADVDERVVLVAGVERSDGAQRRRADDEEHPVAPVHLVVEDEHVTRVPRHDRGDHAAEAAVGLGRDVVLRGRSVLEVLDELVSLPAQVRAQRRVERAHVVAVGELVEVRDAHRYLPSCGVAKTTPDA